MNNMFASATSFNSSLNTEQFTVGQGSYQQTYLAWDVQKVSNLSNVIKNTQVTTSLSNWDTSNATTIQELFKDTSFNQPLVNQQVTVGTGATARTYNAWDVSNVTNMYRVFRDNNTFNQDLSSWDINTTGSVNMREMFFSADSFDQDLSNWTVTNVSNFQNFMTSPVALSTTNYDAILTAWDGQGAMAYSGTVNFGNSVPSCDNVASNGAFAARASLITKWGGITDKFSQNNTCKPLAGFDYSSTAYCANGSDVTPTITGTVDQTLPLGGNISDAWSATNYISPLKITFVIPSSNYTVNSYAAFSETSGTVTIDPGDGSGEQTLTNSPAIGYQYQNPGTYTMIIGKTGDTRQAVSFSVSTGFDALSSIAQYGNAKYTQLIFHNPVTQATYDVLATDSPNLSNASSLTFATNNTNGGLINSNQSLANWDTSNITSLYLAFKNQKSMSSSLLNNWDVSSVTNMMQTFETADISNQDISNWDVRNVTNFSKTFWNALGSANLGKWKLNSSLASAAMLNMFGFHQFNDNDVTDIISGWAIWIFNNSGPFNITHQVFLKTNYKIASQQVITSRALYNPYGYSTSSLPTLDSSGNFLGNNGWSNAGDALNYLKGTTANNGAGWVNI
jgi:hypothetical protein